MATAQIELPPKLVDLFLGEADVRAAYGGRGSAKTRSFAKMSAIRAYMWDAEGREGIILCAREFMNSLDDSSMEEIKAAIRSEPWLEAAFEIGEKYIKTRSGRIAYKFAGLDRNVDSIKSKSRILLCWVDEADPVSDTAWQKLVPTIREEGSELWVTWNPERPPPRSATEQRFRYAQSARIKSVEINWRDNPWFPDKLNREREDDSRLRPHVYEHVWEGAHKTAFEGAYFANLIAEARRENRVGNLNADPLLSIRAYWDIGGTGARADATTIWAVQFVGKEIRSLNYYEAAGQPLSVHVKWLRDNGLDGITCVLPHDGDSHDKVHDVSYRSALEAAGFAVEVIPNQGKGAAAARIEAVRRLLPQCWFDAKCEPGLAALSWYHEKRDDERGIGLGPDHDWSSHAADAFGLMAIAYEEHTKPAPRAEAFKIPKATSGWMRG